MKHALAIILHFSFFILHSSFAAEVVVYSPPSASPLHVAVLSTNDTKISGERVFPPSYAGHRAVCVMPNASTNDVFCAWLGGDTYTPGDPFGVSSGRDVNQIDLTRTSQITPRINLWTGECDRRTTVDDSTRFLREDTSVITNFIKAEDHVVDEQRVRVRVVRYAIDDRFCHSAGVTDTNGTQLVVMDKTYKTAGRNYLCEADFLGDDQFDIDWGTLSGSDFRNGAVVSTSGTPLGTDSTGPRGLGLSVSNMTYLVVLGEGDKDFFGLDSNSVRTVTSLVTRRFEVTRHRPVVAKMSTAYSARPTFTWSIPNEEAYACKFGSSYTAFRLQILETNGTNVVYDSGVRRAPAQDKDGNFVWEAPVCAGQTMANGEVFSATGNWTWRVAMYNAKFMPQSVSLREAWSNMGSFSTAVNE